MSVEERSLTSCSLLGKVAVRCMPRLWSLVNDNEVAFSGTDCKNMFSTTNCKNIIFGYGPALLYSQI